MPERKRDGRPTFKTLEEIKLDSSSRITVERREVTDRRGTRKVIVVVMPGGFADSRLIRRAWNRGKAWHGLVLVEVRAAGGLDVRFDYDDVPETKHLRPEIVDEIEKALDELEEGPEEERTASSRAA